MFKSEAQKFYDACSNLEIAKNVINDCKRVIKELEGPSKDYIPSEYSNCKKNILNCNIDSLVKKVEEVKNNLLSIDSTFNEEYMKIIDNIINGRIDTSDMTEEERMQYEINKSNVQRENDFTTYYMLQKLNDAGALTPELEKEIEASFGTNLAYQTVVIELYKLQDEILVTDSTSKEYIEKLQKLYELTKKQVNLKPNLTDEQRTNILAELEKNYNEQIKTIKDMQEMRKLEQEYESLVNSLGENNSFRHPFVEGEIEDAKLEVSVKIAELNKQHPYAATDDQIEYYNAGWLERTWMNTCTVAVSTFTSVVGIGETFGDAFVMFGGKIGVCDEEWAAEWVKDDKSERLYSNIVKATGMNTHSAYSDYHTITNIVATSVSYAALTYFTGGLAGGAWITAGVGGLSAMGSSSERALQNGATFDQAFGTGATSFAFGLGTGWALGKFNQSVRANTTSLAQVGKNALIGGGISMSEPIVNSAVEYYMYADDLVDENGNKKFDNVFDYFVDSGNLVNTIIAGTSGMISTGMSSYDGYSTYKYKQEFNAMMNSMNEAERSKAWEDYYKQAYGADAVDHTSGKYNFKQYKDTAISRYGQEIYDKFESIIQNPKYYDPDEGFIWPQAEGALEYAGMTDAELYKIGTTQGVEGLKQKGAVISVYEEGKVDTRIGASYGEFSGASGDSIKSRALSPNTEISTAKDLHVYENIDDWTTINQDVIDSAVYNESFTGYSQVADGDKITGIVKVETTAAPWFDSPGGAKQYVYYGVKADGTIATKVLSNGTKQLYKFSMDQLMYMGIIDDITNSVDISLLDSSLISRLAN